MTLVGGKYNGTLSGGAQFNSAQSGYFIFDGIDDTLTFPNPLNQTQLNQVWTVQAWVNLENKSSQNLTNGLANGNYVQYSASNNSLLYLNGGTNDYYTYGGKITEQGWVLATFRFNNATGYRQIFKNTTNISTSGPNHTSTPAEQKETFKATGLQGKISSIMIYDRYLSDAEIVQNFNSKKDIYGL